ncbi:site-specific integrase [Nocardia gipuzkoensis]
MARTTQRDYAYSLLVWLNYLAAIDSNWWDVDDEVATEFLFWRVTDPANERPVRTGSFARDLAGLKKFYKLAERRFGVADPFADMESPRIVRRADVKWLDPGGYERWRDLGIRGFDLTGRPDPWWRGRNEQRDRAFVDGLYGSGLRVSEWASVALPELPAYERRRGFFTCELADGCAKGGYGHKYWIPRTALRTVLTYVEGARAAAVRRARAAGRYERVEGLIVVVEVHGTRSVTTLSDGRYRREQWNDVTPDTRLRLFRRTALGLEPVALWLNENGLPRDPGGWEHTFTAANQRIESLGLENFSCTAHMLRHSFALRWFAVGKLIKYSRLGHLTADEQRDFGEEVGDVWHLVQTMLGHRTVETTRDVYLEPFRSLEVEALLAHADDSLVKAFMADVFADNPWVRTDPLAVTR